MGGVSVVIPAYQAAGTVASAVRSALTQVPPPDEVIVVDDGSTDGTAEVLAGFGADIRVITQPNGGEAAARNAGLAAARSEWVAYLDADDWFLPGRLAAVAELLEADPGLTVVTTDAFLIAAGEIAGRAYGPQWEFAHDAQREAILQRNFVFGHVVVRAEALRAVGGFEESITRTTDWAAWIKVVLAGGRVGLVPRPLSTYRLHGASLSADRAGMAEGSLQSLAVAGRQPSLTADERAVLTRSVGAQQSLLRRERLAASLESGAGGARPRAWAVLRDRGQPPVARAKAASVLVSPALARLARSRRNRGAVAGTAGRPLARAGSPSGGEVTELATMVVVGGGRAADTVQSLQMQGLAVADIVRLERPDGTDVAGGIPCGTFAMVPAGQVLDAGALERRLSAFAWRCEAAAVVDLSDGATGEPGLVEPRLVEAGEATGALAVARPEQILFRTAAVRAAGIPVREADSAAGVLARLAAGHPIVVLGRDG